MNTQKNKTLINHLALSVVILIIFSPAVWSFSPEMRRGMIAGPWELVVKSDMQSEGVQIPITVPDENKTTELNKTIPLIGSTKKIQIEKYLPNLQWKVLSEKYDGHGDTAQIKFSGPNLDQMRWLSTADRARATVSSAIGGVTVKSLHNTPDVDNIVRQLIKPAVIGLVSVVLDEESDPLQFAIKSGFKVELPNSEYKLRVLKYYPHYGIDKKTKKVQNLSDHPVNPAIEVQVQQGKKKFRQWLWSRSSSPHMEYKLPVKVKFSEFNFAAKKGYYELLVASDDKFWLIANDGEKRVIEAAEIDKIYPFADDKYSFKITQIIENSILKDEWHNESDSLNNPALVVSVQDGDQSDRLILQLNSAQQTKGKDGGSVLLFRRKMDVPDGGKK